MIARTPGRGASGNEDHRFSSQRLELDPDLFDGLDDADRPLLQTQFFRDHARTLIVQNDSPDVGFDYSINFYRGCEHGCIYCYARPTHEYLNLSPGLDFESKIYVKTEAPKLLHEKLLSPRWQPQPVAMSGVTDCYQPAERQFQLARQCLQVFNTFKNPVILITKNALITRDVDLLKELAASQCVSVTLSITTLNPKLAQVMEPRASTPEARLRAIALLAANNIPVSVNIAPVIPGLTDAEIPKILQASRDAGATAALYTLVRLPYSVKDLFTNWLEEHFPERKNKVLNTILAMREGKLNDWRFGSRMSGAGAYAENIHSVFQLFARKLGFAAHPKLSTHHFRKPQSQMSLFDSP